MSLADLCQNWELHFSDGTFARMTIMHDPQDNTFSAQASAFIEIAHISKPTMNSWVPCEHNSTAEMAFEEVIFLAFNRTKEKKVVLTKFKHLDGKEFLSEDRQLSVVKKYFPFAIRESNQ